ncbi:M28 family metallopeptidase [Shewanella inventionis]|uniref:Peptidase M28 n=1 Tax=Shewanella inventionis TaxID=1738770 RepID=A0ABQ1JS98_9GAMM|nr:M28 family metallopeptidase [Shewanella inventionis]MCL1159444.1 M28 family metallopeptidase [Shewanella inventionis]GGB73422.1 peptidase M28 [Shewanella inventionis]
MKQLFPFCAVALLSACNVGETTTAPQTPDKSAQVSFDEQRFRADITTLSSDKFEGRAPTTQGEKLTLDYLSAAFNEMGLIGAVNGSYLQAVPMVSYTASEQQSVNLAGIDMQYRQDIVLSSRHDNQQVSIKEAPLVFVGYGINAPEYQWNDYQGVDMKGKIAVILVNDPGFAHPNDKKFNGNAMTYYGRWSYKFEEASRQGALGAIIIHDTKPASYPWSVVENSWTGPQQDLVLAKAEQDARVQVEGWITLDSAKRLFDKAGLSLSGLMDRAADSALNVDLAQTASIAFTNKADYADSYNVVATLPGSSQADEHIVFTAHWDHIGVDDSKEGDNIYNGALDNASGTAGILEIARQFAKQAKAEHGLKRSLTFIATTGEEQGLLGSRYYAANPIYPINKTVAVFNLDSTNVYGKTKDYTIVGKGQSELEVYLEQAAATQNRVTTGESNPASGGFFRSDHFSFAKLGVPAVFAGGGAQPLDEETAQYKAAMTEQMKGCYHNVCDHYREDWDLSGALQDLGVYYQAAHALGNNQDWPGYYAGSEFYPLRPAD